MKLHKLLFANHGAAIYATLIIASGIALALSMPWASKLSELIMQPWRPFPFPFFLMYATLSSLIALSIGAVAAPVSSDNRSSSALLVVLARLSFGHFLMLPLIAYSRVLFPDSVAPLIGATVYVFLISVMMALIAMVMEVAAARRGKHSSVRRYSFLALYFSIPLFGLLGNAWIIRSFALVSPIQALTSLLSGTASAWHWTIAMLVPAFCILGGVLALIRMNE